MTYPGRGPTFVTSIGGTWSGVGGNLGVSSLDGTDWVARTTNANNNTPLESFVNFDSIYSYYDGLSVFGVAPARRALTPRLPQTLQVRLLATSDRGPRRQG